MDLVWEEEGKASSALPLKVKHLTEGPAPSHEGFYKILLLVTFLSHKTDS